MKFNHIILILTFLILSACDQYNLKVSKIATKKIEKKYNNSGFALIYTDNLGIKKLDPRSLEIFHKNLSNKSYVKITNPVNKKSIIAKVKSKNVDFSNFYNSVISTRIAEILELDISEPFVEITLISKNSTFIAKKAKTFEEEKEVAEKAPIEGIKISDLNNNNKRKNNQSKKKKFSYSIKIADFYYKKTAQLMIDKIQTETFLKELKIIELSKTNYRLLLGPFNDIQSLQKSFEKMNSLYFENLEILKNV